MCLKSGWLEFFESYVDRVLKNHNLDGVYYDWNVSLLCSNPSHVQKTTDDVSPDKAVPAPADDHLDIDELIELMEWTRQRLGPDGLIMIHNTRAPMLVTENFANYVVATEWGYKQLADSTPKLYELPLEWNFVNARSRGVIGHHRLSHQRKLRALSALMTSVAPWLATPEATELYKILKPLGNIEQYKFEDWRTKAVLLLNGNNCTAAVYSRQGQAYILLANFNSDPKKITCKIRPQNLPWPLSSLSSAVIIDGDKSTDLNINNVIDTGEDITIPANNAVLIHIKQ